ncbi:MAG TPA: ZIP family metal transporter [Nitrososphaerales archaeon]|nr:ZIP family metal transporter [Nitrososphaerales archaeon]
MVDLLELILLGSVAGFTIFLGLPVAFLGIRDKVRGFLNAFAVGILLFLIVDVFSHAWNLTATSAVLAFQGGGSIGTGAADLVLMFGGITLGLLGLVAYERSYMGKGPDVASPTKVSTMTALGIGAHNLSEGLAIGQAYLGGLIGLNTGLAIVLVVGFAAHNATEGFGITAPLSGLDPKPKVSFVARVLFIGGVPTLLGTLVGSVSFSPQAYIFFLALAGGALVYVTMLMFNTGRRRYSSGLMMGGIFLGLCMGFLTDLIVSLGGA